MTRSKDSLSPVVFRSASTLTLLLVYFLSTAHAGWIIDANGARKVNITELLAAARPVAPLLVTCARGDGLVRVGSTWRERCRQCRCTESGTVCEGPTCALPYHFMQEITCAKWHDDCCCSEVGCMLGNGTTVPVGGAMPSDPSKPCQVNCRCRGGNRTRCLMRSCWPWQCIDMVAPLAGECCPHCPNGRSCVLPQKERKQLSLLELRPMEPVREFSPVILRAGRRDEVTCTCEGNLVAVCKPSLLSGGRVVPLNVVV